MQPTILIGIGSSGLYVLEQVQNFYYENTGRNKPDHVEYLYIETNKDNRPGITALRNEIRRVFISLADMKLMINELKTEHPNTKSWLPLEEIALEAGMGAGGIPACGRLALWGHNMEANNLESFIAAIREAQNNLSGPGRNSEGRPAVFVTGSVTGGTGSGIFLDIAYLIRRLIPGIKELYSLLLLPPTPDMTKGNEVVYANTLGVLKALDHYNKSENRYYTPDEQDAFSEPPYDLNQLVCQTYNDKFPPLHTLGGLYKMAGLYLFLNIIGLRAKRRERLVDAAGNLQIGKYGTFGLSGIQYPKAQIQEYLSLNLGISLLERWVDPKFYYLQNNRLELDDYKITREIEREFGQILLGAFEKMNAAGGYNLMEELRREISVILKKEKGNPRDHIYSLFSPGANQGFYTFLTTKVQQGVDHLIVELNKMVLTTFNRYQSLYYSRKQLNAIADAIRATLEYWLSLGIPRQSSEWEATLSAKVAWMMNNRYDFLMEKQDVLKDRMLTCIEQLKMHLFFDRLVSIGKNIQKEQVPFTTSTLADKVELPIISKLENMIREVEITIGKKDNEEQFANFKSLLKRKSEIEGDMEDKTIPIQRIFPSGGFNNEIKLSYENYQKVTGKSFPTKEILMGEQDLWHYLNDSAVSSIRQKLYTDCIFKFREDIDRFDAVKDFDVSSYVNNNQRSAIAAAQRSVAFLLPIRDKVLNRSANIPKVVIGSDKTLISNVIKSLRQENFTEFEDKSDHILEISELKNIMVFFIEHGNYEPLKDIGYISTVREIDENYPKKLTDMTPEKWNIFRNPYLNQAVVDQNLAKKDAEIQVKKEAKERAERAEALTQKAAELAKKAEEDRVNRIKKEFARKLEILTRRADTELADEAAKLAQEATELASRATEITDTGELSSDDAKFADQMAESLIQKAPQLVKIEEELIKKAAGLSAKSNKTPGNEADYNIVLKEFSQIEAELDAITASLTQFKEEFTKLTSDLNRIESKGNNVKGGNSSVSGINSTDNQET